MLPSGLLWYDDNRDRSIVDKVKNAIERYSIKYGEKPNACYVNHGSVTPDENLYVDGVPVRPFITVLPNHLWLCKRRNK